MVAEQPMADYPIPDYPLLRISPDIAFGRPQLAGYGVSTACIYGRVDLAGESMAAVAGDYDVPLEAVVQAVAYERDRRRSGRRRQTYLERKVREQGRTRWRRKRLADEIATELFRCGSGEVAEQLRLKGKDGRYLGGWCQAAVEDLIERLLSGEKR